MTATHALFAFAIVSCLGACAAMVWAQREDKRRARESIQELLGRIDRRGS
ncbi:hypothetical protein KUW18_10060 [Halomonas sp. DP5Y7-2]|nr:hypothetical protein [Halomonas sp. DP5Y7-2]MBY5984433.1 hypothetical protein [Halomonas sp. DP5Y7-2]